MNCIWCGTETKDEGFFCRGGGETRQASRTDPGSNRTKSYCLDSYITVDELMRKLGIQTSNMKIFKANRKDISDWYKHI